LFHEAACRGAQEAHLLESKSSYTLNELLDRFRREQIAM
jgi:hypothetical protein